ncbi:MAG: DNA polymerase [Firmicutes bacterium]|nr:DNA polymerase [Bacillota bacterium]
MKSSSQAAQVEALVEAQQQGRLAQSLIISGDAEVQDEVLSRLVPRLLCENGGQPGCTCRSCTTAWPQHPDYIELVREGHAIRVGDAHEAVDSLVAGPLWSPSKVVVIRPADSLSREAESYLLKHLEEPPAYVHYLLLTEFPDSLLATIRSRCHHWRFAKGGNDDDVVDLTQRLWSEPLTAERVVQATYWARRQYVRTAHPAWLTVWETLESTYRQLEANGNAELAAAQIRRVWPMTQAR